jgi:hypothetical protein
MQIRACLLALSMLACLCAAQPVVAAAKPKPKHGKKVERKKHKRVNKRVFALGAAGSWKKVTKVRLPDIQGAPGDMTATTTDKVDWEANGRATVKRTGRGLFDARVLSSALKGKVTNLSQNVDYMGYRFDPVQRSWVGCPATYDERLEEPLKLSGSLLYGKLDYLEPNFGEPAGPVERSQSQPERCNVFPPLGPQQTRVVRQEQLAAVPPEPELECKTLGSWEAGWSHECHASITRPALGTGSGQTTEIWAWALSLRPIRNAP